MGHLKDNTELVARVRRIAGQVTSVEKALVSDAPCATVLHRVAAVRGAVNGLLDEIIAQHLTAHVAADGLSHEERAARSEEHTSELQSLMRISYAVFCLKKTTTRTKPISSNEY